MRMHAALVEDFKAPPRFREVDRPTPKPGELLIAVTAAALSNLVRGQASGGHYSSSKELSFTPGNDGVGTTEGGTRVYFLAPRAPFGSMAEFTVVSERMVIPLPSEVDDVTAAALGNPGLATWGSLLGRAKLKPGEGVLVNGATGAAGKLAVQTARHLGASSVIATGRNQISLQGIQELGADQTIPLDQSNERLQDAFGGLLRSGHIQVVLDYLWGASAEAILQSAAGHGSAEGEPRIRYVQIGSISGRNINLPGDTLRSSGIELMGSGLGSLSAESILASLRAMYQATKEVRFTIDIKAVPLTEVETAWTNQADAGRIVFVPALP